MITEYSLRHARHLDSLDPLASFREEFYCQPGQIYMDGNSLGLASRSAEAALMHVLEDWKRHGIEGWTEAVPAWFTMAEELGSLTAGLIGAEPEAVVVTNSTTVNLHQLLATLFLPEGVRTKILADSLNFPSDIYALQSHLRLRGLDPKDHLLLVESEDGLTLDEDQIIEQMTPDVQLALFPAVLYHSGQLLDMPRLTAEAHRHGLLIGFDCSHSIGSVPHHLDDWQVDFAFWCSYKYLNGGPGAAGGLYLNRRHFGKLPGLAGWFGSDKSRQFDMSHSFAPAMGAGALQIGTPNILSMAPLLGSLRTLHEAGMEQIREKSLRLTECLLRLTSTELSGYGVSVVTPPEPERRGGHIALSHPEAVRICKALRRDRVIPDFRPPHIVRLAPVALYTGYADIYEAIVRLKNILQTESYREFPETRGVVP